MRRNGRVNEIERVFGAWLEITFERRWGAKEKTSVGSSPLIISNGLPHKPGCTCVEAI